MWILCACRLQGQLHSCLLQPGMLQRGCYVAAVYCCWVYGPHVFYLAVLSDLILNLSALVLDHEALQLKVPQRRPLCGIVGRCCEVPFDVCMHSHCMPIMDPSNIIWGGDGEYCALCVCFGKGGTSLMDLCVRRGRPIGATVLPACRSLTLPVGRSPVVVHESLFIRRAPLY